MKILSGRGAVWLARLVWDQEVGGSNPLAPTFEGLDIQTESQETSAGRWSDPVIEAFKRDVDRTLLREALKLTPGQRLLNLQQLCEGAEQLRLAGKKAKAVR